MEDKQKTRMVDESSVCFCSGALPHYDLKADIAKKPDANLQEARAIDPGADSPNCRTINRKEVLRQLEERQIQITEEH